MTPRIEQAHIHVNWPKKYMHPHRWYDLGSYFHYSFESMTEEINLKMKYPTTHIVIKMI